MAANFGKFFGRKKKTPKLKNQGSTQADDSDDDEGYQDPTESCPTEPPGVARTFMPNYPPPRPNSPKMGAKQAHPPQQAQQQQPKRDDYQDPWDSKSSQDVNKNKNGPTAPPLTDYEDPFDSKFAAKKQASLNDDDTEEYSEPYEPTTSANFKGVPPADTYEDPWDTRKNINSESLRTMSSSQSQTVNISKPISKRDDYSDPWDSKESSSFKSTEDYDDTYSDPYDTDKPTILDGTNRIPSTEHDDDDDIYDLPDDEKNIVLGKASTTNGIMGNTKSNFHTSQPNKIIRPPRPVQPAIKSATIQCSQGDYDAPWEWQAKSVEEEFAKRFSVGDARQHPNAPMAPPRKKSSPSPLIKNMNININPLPKPARNTFKTDDGPKAYEIDPTIPLDNQAWFHGRIRRGEAESLLRALPDCSYLLRNSESNKVDYSLSLRNHGETMHLKISCKEGRYILGMNSRPYDTIPDMIHHYSKNKLNIRGAEHVKLQFPVLQEAMYFTVEPGT